MLKAVLVFVEVMGVQLFGHLVMPAELLRTCWTGRYISLVLCQTVVAQGTQCRIAAAEVVGQKRKERWTLLMLTKNLKV